MRTTYRAILLGYLFWCVSGKKAVVGTFLAMDSTSSTHWLSACPTTYEAQHYTSAKLFGKSEFRRLALYQNGFKQQFSVGTCKSAAPFGNIRGICEVAQQRHLAWLILPQREVKTKTMCFGRIGTFFRRCLGWIELPGSCQLKYSAGSLSPR